MELEEFQELLQEKLGEIEELVDQLPDKGDKCETSQKVCIKKALFEVESSINGLTLDDFI